jgi:hypothetical protein
MTKRHGPFLRWVSVRMVCSCNRTGRMLCTVVHCMWNRKRVDRYANIRAYGRQPSCHMIYSCHLTVRIWAVLHISIGGTTLVV